MNGAPWRDLAPSIYRQRLVLEGTCALPVDDDQIKRYLRELTAVLEMRVLFGPVTHRSDRFGWAGWIHWENSGAHFYAWDDPTFFSVDIYTCKAFAAEVAKAFTCGFFDAIECVHREF